MLLCDALSIQDGDVVSFVGAGGKTTACMQIAREMAERGRRALVTTTTKILEPVPGQDERLLLTETLDQAMPGLSAAFEDVHRVIWARRRLRESVGPDWLDPDYILKVLPGKLEGVPTEWVDEVHETAIADVTLVEADGAAGRMLKAPAAREPVIPASTTVVVPMADVECLGKTLVDEFVHRPVLLADIASVWPGSLIGPELIAVALAHPEGGLKSVPEGARVVPLLTTHHPGLIDDDMLEVASLLLLSPRIAAVALSYLRSTPVKVEVFAP